MRFLTAQRCKYNSLNGRKVGFEKAYVYLIGCVLRGDKGVAVFIFLQQSDATNWGLQRTHRKNQQHESDFTFTHIYKYDDEGS